MNINLITTLLVYAVSLHRGLKSGGHFILCSPYQKVGVIPPVSCTHAYRLRRTVLTGNADVVRRR